MKSLDFSACILTSLQLIICSKDYLKKSFKKSNARWSHSRDYDNLMNRLVDFGTYTCKLRGTGLATSSINESQLLSSERHSFRNARSTRPQILYLLEMPLQLGIIPIDCTPSPNEPCEPFVPCPVKPDLSSNDADPRPKPKTSHLDRVYLLLSA